MKRSLELAFVALCIVLIALTTLPGCKRRVSPAPTPKPTPTVGIVAKADALESKLEARLRWDAAQMLEDGATLREVRDWLKSKWPNAAHEACEPVRAAERDTIKEPADAIALWRQWALEVDPTLKGKP